MTTTQAHMRRMVAQRWRERDLYGVWFWTSWLFMRWHVLPILAGIVSLAVGYLVFGGFR